jgi:beta-exotoxin I transport system permease protein
VSHVPLVRKTLRDLRTATIWIGLAVFLMALFDVLIYPEYKASIAGMEIPEFFEGFLGEAGSLATPEGFFAAEFFSWVPLLVITLAIIGGTGTLAGEEDAGTLDLLLAQPVTRTRALLEKALGLSIAIALATLAAIPGFLLGMLFADVEIGAGRLFAATLAMLPLALLFLALSIWGGATLANRGAAAAVAIGAVVVGYFVYTLGATVGVLETPRRLTPFYWCEGSYVLVHGLDPLRIGGTLLLAAALLGLALLAFQRRDLASGAREWSLASLARAAVTRRRYPRRHAASAEGGG